MQILGSKLDLQNTTSQKENVFGSRIVNILTISWLEIVFFSRIFFNLQSNRIEVMHLCASQMVKCKLDV